LHFLFKKIIMILRKYSFEALTIDNSSSRFYICSFHLLPTWWAENNGYLYQSKWSASVFVLSYLPFHSIFFL